jgi:FemAB-related protein (PEP-CTERM system-associated)
MSILVQQQIEIRTWGPGSVAGELDRLESYLLREGRLALSRHPAWLNVLARGLRHVPYLLEARAGEQTCGLLPLALVRSLLFGRFLVSLPYLNSGGVVADSASAAGRLIDRAAELADELRVHYLELRHERPVAHPRLTDRFEGKVHMRLPLPATAEKLWDGLKAKVRNQVRKGQRNELAVVWGGLDLLDDFYAVFCRNMRDLGTPVYGRGLFRAVLEQFPERAEFCVVRAGSRPIAASLLLHGWGITEVPSASSLRTHSATNANMLMYWHLLQRAVERGQSLFDFGRSSKGSSTYQFKTQWGALSEPAEWQYYRRDQAAAEMRRDNARFGGWIRLWKRLPVGLTRLIGPLIVRGIP